MKRLRLLGLMLMAVFALGAAAAATASAVEIGALTLTELAGLEILHEEKNETLANKGKLEASGQTLECKKLWVLPGKFDVANKKHWALILDLDFHFSECESNKIKCKTGTDTNGTLLVLVDAHLVAFESGGKLIPGVIFVILNEKLEPKPITITCGVIKIEVKGTAPAKAVQLSEALKEVTEGETKRFTVAAEPGLLCDTVDTLCKELLTPLEANFGGGFAAAKETTEPQKMAYSEDVTWDY